MGKAAIGILMLDTKFPRVLGDIGHIKTWDFPVYMRVVRGASASHRPILCNRFQEYSGCM